jgi:hypothetical protein
MAIINNAPTQGYIYIKDLSIKYNEQIFPINNIYTKDKYIYWKIETSDLVSSNNKLDDKEDLIFIIKNIEGVSVTTTTDTLEMLFDGYNKKSIAEKLKGVTENNKFYKKQLEITQDNIESLSKEYQENLSFEQIKELLNTAIINSNSLMIDLKTTLTDRLSDETFNSAEKADVNYRLDTINNKFEEMLGYSDALIDMMAENSNDVDTTSFLEYQLSLQKMLADLIVEIKIVTEDDRENITLADISSITSNITTILITLSSFKDSCSTILSIGSEGEKTLGASSTISDEVYNTNARIDDLSSNMSELQASLINSFAKEQQTIQGYFDANQKYSNDMLPIINSLLNVDGKLTVAQYNSLDALANGMVNYVSKIEASYQSYYNNEKLGDNNKQLLKEYFDDFKAKHTDFINSIKVDMKDLIFNKDERKRFTIRLALYREARNKLNSQMLNCINLINSATSEVNLQQIEKRLNDKILEVQNQVNDLNSKIGNINSRLSNIESRLDALENNTNV